MSRTHVMYRNCDTNCLVVFAPTNEAMDRAFPNGLPSGEELRSFVQHHYVKGREYPAVVESVPQSHNNFSTA